MESILSYLIFSVGFNLFLFLIAYLFQTDKITDISYSLTFITIAIFSFVKSEQSIVDIALMTIVVVWAIRLGSYLLYRVNFMGHDARFDDIRNNFLSFFTFWLMQGLTCFIVMLPVLLTNQTNGKSVGLILILGMLLAILGLIVESVADFQKFNFKKKNPDKFMKNGIWSYLQHPNYTGELLFWWALFIASIPYSSWYFGIWGPLWISLIIIVFSGVRILQKNWKERYGNDPDFIDYHRKTYKLIPFIY